MAENIGLLKFKGQAGGLSFYQMNGKHIVSAKKGPSKEQVLNDPQFKRARENMKEFGGASVAGKAFRKGFSELIQLTGDSYITGRLTALMQKIIKAGGGERGKRIFDIKNNSNILNGFEFSRKRSLFSVFKASYEIHFRQHTNTIEWTVPKFDPRKLLAGPENSSHFELSLTGIILSSYMYDEVSGRYVPVFPEAEKMKVFTASMQYSVNAPLSEDIVLKGTFDYQGFFPEEVCLLCGIGVRFFQCVNSETYEIQNGNAGRVEF